jgi:hypothetical protein
VEADAAPLDRPGDAAVENVELVGRGGAQARDQDQDAGLGGEAARRLEVLEHEARHLVGDLLGAVERRRR